MNFKCFQYAMELNDSNIQTLAAYLQKTLSPDPTERRGGWYKQ